MRALSPRQGGEGRGEGAQADGASTSLHVRLSDTIALPVPPARAARYRPHVGRSGLILGLRPEHLTEARHNGGAGGNGAGSPSIGLIDAALEVTEPLGMETLVFFTIAGTEICGRVHPSADVRPGVRLPLAAQLDHMHLIDEGTGRVV